MTKTQPSGGGGVGGVKKKSRKKNNKPVPLAPPPTACLVRNSRKRARQITTLFHKYTKQRDATNDDQERERLDRMIQEMGGRAAYQKASQISTAFYSTSKWVLGYLSRNGWIHGIPTTPPSGTGSYSNEKVLTKEKGGSKKASKQQRRFTRVLEVGAINTELLDAAAAQAINPTASANKDGDDFKSPSAIPAAKTTNNNNESTKKKYRLDVRAIDLHSMHDGRIEEQDFLKLKLPTGKEKEQRYDVIVCSMVLNSVTTAHQRGEMLCRLHYFLNPNSSSNNTSGNNGGLCFITLPRSCLELSPWIDSTGFQELLAMVGLSVVETKLSPKVAFFVCQRGALPTESTCKEALARWGKLKPIRQGKKYRNDFSVTLSRGSLMGLTIEMDYEVFKR